MSGDLEELVSRLGQRALVSRDGPKHGFFNRDFAIPYPHQPMYPAVADKTSRFLHALGEGGVFGEKAYPGESRRRR